MDTLYQKVERADSNFLYGLAISFDISEAKVNGVDMVCWNHYISCKYLIEEITKEEFDAKLKIAIEQLNKNTAMKFFAHIGQYNVPKNKLQKAIADHLETLDGLLVKNEYDFIESLKTKVEELNNTYAKCQPLRVSTFDISNSGIGLSFGELWGCNAYLYKVKEVDNGE